MGRAQIRSTSCQGHDGLFVVHGRGLDDGCTIRYFFSDGTRASVRPYFVDRGFLIAAGPQVDQGPTKAVIANPDAEVSREVRINAPADTRVPVHYLTSGDAVEHPFRVALIANPFYKRGARISRDPILRAPDFFRTRVGDVFRDIYKRPSQTPLAEPRIRQATQVYTIFDPDLAAADLDNVADALTLCEVIRPRGMNHIQASRRRVQSFLERYGCWADVAIVISCAPSSIPTGWFATDNYSRNGVPFTFDGREYLHCYYVAVPGVVAFSIRPIRRYEVQHELCHALSSYNSGQILDEYDLRVHNEEGHGQSSFAVNKKFKLDGDFFAEYNQTKYPVARLNVDGRQIYVPAAQTGKFCLMHRLRKDPVGDRLIQKFLRDRLNARINRPF